MKLAPISSSFLVTVLLFNLLPSPVPFAREPFGPNQPVGYLFIFFVGFLYYLVILVLGKLYIKFMKQIRSEK